MTTVQQQHTSNSVALPMVFTLISIINKHNKIISKNNDFQHQAFKTAIIGFSLINSYG